MGYTPETDANSTLMDGAFIKSGDTFKFDKTIHLTITDLVKPADSVKGLQNFILQKMKLRLVLDMLVK